MVADNTPPIYYINLDRRADRRARMEAQLGALGLHGERIPAVTPQSLSAQARRALSATAKNRRLSEPEMAGKMSHRLALDTIVRSGAPMGIVLEDDAVLARVFRQQVGELAGRGDFDLVRLETMSRVYRVRLPGVPSGPGFMTYPMAEYDFGIAAYMITAEAAEAFLAQPVEAIYPPDDWLIAMNVPRPRHLRLGQLVPAIAVQECNRNGEGYDPVDSDLVDARLERTGPPIGGLRQRYPNPVLRETARIVERVRDGAIRARIGAPVVYRSRKIRVDFADDLAEFGGTPPSG